MIKRFFFTIGIFSLALFSLNCGRPAGVSASSNSAASTATASFSSINASIITPICLNCHKTQAPVMTSYAQIMASGAVVASNPSGSTLYTQVSAGTMPLGEGALPTADVQAIYNWIQAGAPNN